MAKKKVGIDVEVTGAEESASKLSKVANSLEKNTDKQVKNNKVISESITKNKQYAGTLDKISSKLTLTNLRTVVDTFKRVGQVIDRAVQASSDYIEDLNLLDSAFGNSREEARKFANNLAEVYGFDESSFIKAAGTFRQFGEALGFSSDKANVLAENLTLMAGDVSSLYNITYEQASEKLTSALTGQTKAIRSLGADITQASLQQQLYNMGINESISDMNRAEKTLLIYMSLTKQLATSQGDLAKTLESPSNQLKVMKEQFQRLSRAIGNVFLPIIKAILPWINGLLMALVEVVNFIATLVGYDPKDFEFGGALTENASDMGNVFDDTTDSIGGTNKALDETKKKLTGLRGFDKLNVITTPTDKSSSGAGGGIGGVAGGGINSKLLDGLKDYNAHLSEASKKAQEIRDNILKWLGFTKDVNGEWKLTNLTIGNVAFALLSVVTSILTIKKILNVIAGIKGFVSGVSGLLGIGKHGKTAKDALESASGISKTANSTASSFKLPSFKTILKGIGELALIIISLIAIVEAIGLISKIPGAKETATQGVKLLGTVFGGLLKIVIPLGLFSAGIVALGTLPVSTIVKGVADLAIIIGGLTVLVFAVGAITQWEFGKSAIEAGIQVLQDILKPLGSMALELGVLSLIIIGLGIVSPATVALGLAGLAIILGGLEILIIAMGAVTKIPGVKDLINGGIDTLIKLAEGIGGFAGALVGSFVAEATSGLGKIGKHLSEFMENAQPFFEGLQNVKSSNTKAVKDLAEVVLILTANNILEGLTSWFAGETDLVGFGKELKAFAPYFASYANTISEAKIDGKIVSASANAAKSLAQMAKELPNSGGLAGWFAGENNLDKFGSMLPKFGKDISSYAKNVGKLDTKVVTSSANAAKALAEMAKNLPNSGGMASWFAGDNKLSSFGKMLPKFGTNMKDYSDNLKGINLDRIKTSTSGANTILDFAKKIDGYSSLKDFGEKIKDFGSKYKSYYSNIKGISDDKITSVTNGIKKLTDLLSTIKSKGLGSIAKSFGNSVSDMATDIKDFFKNNFSKTKAENIGWDFGVKLAQNIAKGFRSISFPTISLTNTKDGKTTASYKLKAYAQGGFPNMGEFFIAREKGAEMVGSINGKTAVANNDQIVEAVASGVARAVASSGLNNSRPIIIEGKGDASGLLNFITFKQKQQERQFSL